MTNLLNYIIINQLKKGDTIPQSIFNQIQKVEDIVSFVNSGNQSNNFVFTGNPFYYMWSTHIGNESRVRVINRNTYMIENEMINYF